MLSSLDLQYLNTLPDNAVLSPRQFCAVAGFSDTTLWRLQKLGEGPSRMQLSERRYGYQWGAVKAWLKAREQVPA